MDSKEKNSDPLSKYLHRFFPGIKNKPKLADDKNLETSEKPSVSNICTSITPKLEISAMKKTVSEHLFTPGSSQQSAVLFPTPFVAENLQPQDDMWGNDFPEDFSEDCILTETESEKKIEGIDAKQPETVKSAVSSRPHITNPDVRDVTVTLSGSGCRDNQFVQLHQMALIAGDSSSLSQSQSQSQSQKIVLNPPTKSLPQSTSCSQALTTEWLRNQLDKVNREYVSLKDSLIAKEGEGSLLRNKLRDAELETQKIKQQLISTSSNERIKFEEQIKELQKQLNNAKTQILFKSKEAESNLERYLELKSLNIREPEFTQAKTTMSCGFRKMISRGEQLPFQDTSIGSYNCDPIDDVFVSKKKTQMSMKKTIENEISKLNTKVDIGKELEFFVHPDLFNESELEFNFVIPPSTDYYPFNVMYKDISEMPTDDFTYEPSNLYSIWKVKRESFGEIMSEVIDVTSDGDSDSDTSLSNKNPVHSSSIQSTTHPQPTKTTSITENSCLPSSIPTEVLEVDKNSQHETSYQTSNGSQGEFSNTTLPKKEKGSHPRFVFLGKSRYFTSLREIYLPLIEMCKSSSWKKRDIHEVTKHITNMTRELYVAMCDPSIDSYYSTMHLRDNQIIDSCSDVSELNLEYNIFSPKKWREKEIYVDLRRGIALIKVLCDLDHGCMELILNSSVKKHSTELPLKSTKKIKKTVKAAKEVTFSCCNKNLLKPSHKATNQQLKKTGKKQYRGTEQQATREIQRSSLRIITNCDEMCHKCHLTKRAAVSKKGGNINSEISCFIEPSEPWSWRFNEDDVPSFVMENENRMGIDKNRQKIKIVFANDCIERRGSTGELKNDMMEQTIGELIGNINEVESNTNEFPFSAAGPLKILNARGLNLKEINHSVNEINANINEEIFKNTKHFDEHLNQKITKSLKSLEKKNDYEEWNESVGALNKISEEAQFSIMDKIIKNEQLPWVTAVKSCLIPIDEKSSTKDIMALRKGTCCSETEKEFLSRALSTFDKIKSNMKSGSIIEEDNGKKRKLSDDTSGNSKKVALSVNHTEVLWGNDPGLNMVDQKLLSENVKSSLTSFSLKKKRDLRPLRKSLKDDAIAGTAKDEPNLDKEIEMEIQKIFNKHTDMKPKSKKKDKSKEKNLLNCDDVAKTERFYNFNFVAHSGGFLTLLFEVIREIGRKRYTINFNCLFAVIINLIHTLLKNGNPGVIQRHFLFDILQEILYCRPSPIALLQMNKLLVDVISVQPFFTSLMCHNANSNHMVIDSESAFFSRGACFIEVICSLIDYFMNENDWEIQTYYVRWISYMYLVEKTTIEEWYSTQKTICRRCQCIMLLTNTSVKIFEMASSYYLLCSIENNLSHLLNCQLLEIMQSGVKVLYVMIDFDKHFSENIGDRYGMFLRFLDTVKLIHRHPGQFKEFNDNNKDLDIVQLLLIEEKVVGNIAKTSSTSQTINKTSQLFSMENDQLPKTFLYEQLFLSEMGDNQELSD